MAGQTIAVILHGITGRMGQVAHQALEHINTSAGVKIEGQVFMTIPIGLGRNKAGLESYAQNTPLEFFYDNIEEAYDHAVRINRNYQIYHNLTTTGSRVEVLSTVLPLLDPSTTGVFLRKTSGCQLCRRQAGCGDA